MLPATSSFDLGLVVPMPTFPELFTKNLVEAFTCTLNGVWPEALLIWTLEFGAVVPNPQRPLLVSRPRSLLLLLNKTEKLVVDPSVPLAASALPLVSQF